ncbi:hypothetical protein QMQ04_29980, partial [Escherichia coli]|nr:hypothetical protein [Escherichia coli]
LLNAIQTAITDDRWSGKRNPDVLAQQRYDIISGSQTGNRESIIQPELQRSGPDKTLTDNITRSFMSAMAEQKLKLEITMIDGKG